MFITAPWEPIFTIASWKECRRRTYRYSVISTEVTKALSEIYHLSIGSQFIYLLVLVIICQKFGLIQLHGVLF